MSASVALIAHRVPVGPAPVASAPMLKLLRRAVFALAVAAAVAGVLRVRGRGGTPPQHGGWQPIDLPER